MNIIHTLNETLLKQPFNEEEYLPLLLNECQQMAKQYAKIENAIAVLSDLRANKSYIYYGKVASSLGLPEESNGTQEIDSIWEDKIFSCIHPDDLLEKHLLELQFFQLLKSLPNSKRSDYHVLSKIRMKDKSGKYIIIQHRMFYVYSSFPGNLWLALCLYNHEYENTELSSYYGMIINSATGDIIKPDRQKCSTILSDREKEVLILIEKGRISKEIAIELSISINTVNRHRQNILEKLRVKNAIEACKVAKSMLLF